MPDAFSADLVGRTATTRHGERGIIVGAAKDPGRCTFRPEPVTERGRSYKPDGSWTPIETFTPRVSALTLDVPDVLYYVSAAVMRRRQLEGSSEHWRVQLPGFYLDSRVQVITSEDHACGIVRTMLESLGHASEDVTVYACATLAPVHDRSGAFTYALDLDRGEYVVYRDGAEVGAHGWEPDARRQCDDRRVS